LPAHEDTDTAASYPCVSSDRRRSLRWLRRCL